MRAEWLDDYDHRTDKCFKRPMCPECYAPVFEEGEKYVCVSCQQELEVDDDMAEWIWERNGTKVEIEDCFPAKMIFGKKLGCGGKGCMEVRYMKNPVTLEWQVMGGKCTKCGMRCMV